MATANNKKKIERAYTPKDLESENLECILSPVEQGYLFSG